MKPKAIIFTVFLLVSISITGYAQISFESQRAALTKILKSINQIQAEISRIDRQLDDINGKITTLEDHEELTWIEQRRLVKLTEDKLDQNAIRVENYEKLLTQQTAARHLSSELIDSISAVMDSSLDQLSLIESEEDRQIHLNNLLGIIELRNWIIDQQMQFTHTEETLFPQKIDLRDFLTTTRIYPQIHNDLLNLMDHKIRELSVMIETAKEEEMLQNKLDQFSMEMASIGGEIREQPTVSDEEIYNTPEIDFTYTNNPTERDVDYANWAKGIAPSSLSTLSPIDYLPIIKTLSPSELPDYIFTLDSLRNYYITEKQKLLNR